MTPSVFDPGLSSITAAETSISDLDGEAGELVVRGYPIADIAANATYEETVYLLLYGRLPTSNERRAFRADLAGRREIDPAVAALLDRAAETDCDVMDALRMGVAAATLGTDDREPLDLAKRVVAVVPTVVATYWRHSQGNRPIAPTEDLGHAANYRYMLTGTAPSASETNGLEAFLTTLAEHGLNASTFTARTVVSTESDLVSAATAAVGTLKGPRHAGNLATVLDLLEAGHESDDPEAFVRDRLDGDGSLPGFGHRVYQVRDPRAAVLSAATERLADTQRVDEFLATVRDLEAAGVDALAERHPARQSAPTVEFYAAALLRAVGVPRPLLAPTFAVSRVGGWMAHCLEQLEDNEVIRPVARYVGDTGRAWQPVGERSARRPIEPVSETLATLAEPARLEIVLALAEAPGPVEYSALRAATSIEDKGRFNYHLRQLQDSLVKERETGYALTETGTSLVRSILREEALLGDN